jgi:hypothetical protein
MGSVPLNVTSVTGDVAANVSVHLWCTATGNGVTMAFVNPTADDVAFTVNGVSQAARTEFVLTADASSYSTPSQEHTWSRKTDPLRQEAPPPFLGNDTIFCNGERLVVTDDGLLPVAPIPGASVPAGASDFIAPSYSYGFVAYAVHAPACA